MPSVSIVVPVYKTEKYIHRCVESLTKQTLSDIEIILVDDGSPDNCPQICDALAKLDDRINVIHNTNGGLSNARNAGLRMATGKYIGFVDSDDDVQLDMYEKMLVNAEKHNADFVICDYQRIEAENVIDIKTLDINGGYYDREKIVNIVFPNLIMRETIDYGPLLSVWNCLYRRDFLFNNKLVFDEEVRWSEDNIFSAIMGYYCNSFYYMKGEALYHYYNNPGTITTSYREGSWKVYSTMNEHLHKFFDKVTDYDFSRQLKLHLMYYASNCVNQEASLPKEQALKRIKEVLNSPNLREAFCDFKMPRVNYKLKVQLYLMKYIKSKLLYYMRHK